VLLARAIPHGRAGALLGGCMAEHVGRPRYLDRANEHLDDAIVKLGEVRATGPKLVELDAIYELLVTAQDALTMVRTAAA
jgi:hypothetical protein